MQQPNLAPVLNLDKLQLSSPRWKSVIASPRLKLGLASSREDSGVTVPPVLEASPRRMSSLSTNAGRLRLVELAQRAGATVQLSDRS